MKRLLTPSRSSKRSGFTLVELLVVIGIIGILAAVLLPAASSAIRAAKRAKAQNTASQIQTACMSYYTEYGVYPVPTGTTTDYLILDTTAGTDTGGIADAAAWKILLCALCGNISPLDASSVAATTIANSRSISFLSLNKADVYDSANPTFVAPVNPLPTGTSKYFNIAIDSNYDGLLGTAAPTQGVLPNFTKSTTTAMDYTGTSTAGVVLWENCNAFTTSTNPNFWIRTY